MFARSAAETSGAQQSKAIQAVNVKWGEDVLSRSGRETIGIPVCKKKYKPFRFDVVKKKGGGVEVQVVRMFACQCHHDARKAVIETHGLRKGWVHFGQWSMKKAQEMARHEAARLNAVLKSVKGNDGIQHQQDLGGDTASPSSSSGEEEEEDDDDTAGFVSSPSAAATTTIARPMCLNGSCTWKVRSKFDDIEEEMLNQQQQEQQLLQMMAGQRVREGKEEEEEGEEDGVDGDGPHSGERE